MQTIEAQMQKQANQWAYSPDKTATEIAPISEKFYIGLNYFYRLGVSDGARRMQELTQENS